MAAPIAFSRMLAAVKAARRASQQLTPVANSAPRTARSVIKEDLAVVISAQMALATMSKPMLAMNVLWSTALSAAIYSILSACSANRASV